MSQEEQKNDKSDNKNEEKKDISKPKSEIGPGKIICQKYFVSQKIGQGSFGSVYAGYDLKTSESIAIKVEEVVPGEDKRRKDILLKEAKFLYNLNGEKGFPRMIYFTKTESKRIMVISLLGRNLESLFRKCNRKFTLKTVLMLADQMISRLEYIHSKEIIHRDLKPENFLVGLEKNANTIYLIDFGLSKKFIEKGVHIPYKEKVGLVGTARYTSINSHLGNEQSRRDDLESLGYILIYFLKGELPWMNLNGQTKEEKHKLIVNMKLATSIEKLCEGIPKEFQDYMKYVRKELNFEDEPNYIYLKKMFRTLLINSKLDMNYVFDWQNNNFSKIKNPSEMLMNEKMASNAEIEKNYKSSKTKPNLNKTYDLNRSNKNTKENTEQRLNITQYNKKNEVLASDESNNQNKTFTKVLTSKAIFLNQTNFIDELELDELENLEEFDINPDDEIFNVNRMKNMKINPFMPNKSLSCLNSTPKQVHKNNYYEPSENLIEIEASEYVSYMKVRDLVACLGQNHINQLYYSKILIKISMKILFPHKSTPIKPQIINKVNRRTVDLPKEQVFSFSRPEKSISPSLKTTDRFPLKHLKFPSQPFRSLVQKFRDFSNRLHSVSPEKDQNKFDPSKKRALSTVLDKNTANNIKKASLPSNIKTNTTKLNGSISNENNTRKSSLSVFENFTGRKVSEFEYYAESPTFKHHNKKDSYFKADKKIDRIQRLQIHGKKLQYPFLIIPIKSKFKFFWDLLITLLIFLNSLLNPVEIAFEQQGNEINQAFNLVLIIFYISDIILSMRTTYFDENNDEILDGVLLFKNYLKSKAFVIDLISAIPLSEITEYILQGTSQITYIKFINLLKFIRLLRLTRIFSYFQNDSYKIIFQIARLTIIFIITFHWATCLWIFLITIQYDSDAAADDNTWMPINYRGIMGSIDDPSPNHFVKLYYETDEIYAQYLNTLYSILLMVIGSEMGTVGVVQTLFAILICIVGSFFYAIFFSEMMLLISKLNFAYSLYQTKLDELDMKLQTNNIPINVQEKIHEYYNFYWKKQRIFQNLSDFSKLSESLKREILFYTHKDIVLNVPLFHALEPHEILRIIEKLKPQIFMPGDLIIQEGKKGTEMFFLTEGVAEILIKKENKLLSIILSKGAYFGEIALITNSLRTSDVKAIDFCIVEIFTKDDYELLKQQYPDINIRLTAGLKHYKKNHLENILNILKKNDLFKEISNEDLIFIVMNYMNEIFVDIHEIVLKPKKRTNALYFLLLGKMEIYNNTEESKSLIKELIDRKNKSIMDQNDLINMSNLKKGLFNCLDDDLADFPHLFQDDCRLIRNKIGSLNVGDMIGGISFESNHPKSEFYYITESACHFCVFTQANFEQLRSERIDLYMKITENYNKAKIFYERKLVLEAKDVFSVSNIAISPSTLLTSSSVPKQLRMLINVEKAKKSVFLEDGVLEKKNTNKFPSHAKHRISNSKMISSTINDFSVEEEKENDKFMYTSVFPNNPILEESSENSEKEEKFLETIKEEKEIIEQTFERHVINNFLNYGEEKNENLIIEGNGNKSKLKKKKKVKRNKESLQIINEHFAKMNQLAQQLDRICQEKNDFIFQRNRTLEVFEEEF